MLRLNVNNTRSACTVSWARPLFLLNWEQKLQTICLTILQPNFSILKTHKQTVNNTTLSQPVRATLPIPLPVSTRTFYSSVSKKGDDGIGYLGTQHFLLLLILLPMIKCKLVDWKKNASRRIKQLHSSFPIPLIYVRFRTEDMVVFCHFEWKRGFPFRFHFIDSH